MRSKVMWWAILGYIFLMASSFSFAQVYTVVSANNVTVDNGSGTPVNPPSGTNLCFLGVNTSGAAITYTPAGGSPVSGAVCQTLNSSGALTGSLQVANAATASPAGLLYTITVINGSTTYLTVPKASVTGTLFPYDAYAITGNGSVQGIGYPHIGCNVGAQWTSTTINPGGAGCVLVGSSGAWATYPQYPQYCPYGQAYLAPQGAGTVPLCLSASLTGNGSPTGACVNKSTYFQQNAATGAFLWGCVNNSWQQITGGSGGGGLTSFQGRTTAAATLMASDITSIFASSPFIFTGGGGLAYDSASGTPSPTPNWKISGTSLLGNGNLGVYSSGFSGTPTFFVNASTGAMSAASGNFAVGSGGGLAFGGGTSISSSNNVCQTNGTNCPGASSVFYQYIQNNTSAVQTQRNKTSYVTASGIQSADNSGNSSTDISLSAIPNASLANPSVTINTVGGVSGGGSLALGSSITITGSPTFTPSNQTCTSTCTLSETATYNHVILSGNVATSTLAAGSDGFCTNINIEQDGTGGRTWAWPSNTESPFTIGTFANRTSGGQYCYSALDSLWHLQGVGFKNQ